MIFYQLVAIAQAAQQIARDEYETEFLDLPTDIRAEVYRAAEIRYFDFLL